MTAQVPQITIASQRMRFAKIEIDPRINPAILDSVTWDSERARRIVGPMEPWYWHELRKAIAEGGAASAHQSCTAYRGSAAQQAGNEYVLLRLSDGQHVFASLGAEVGTGPLGDPLQVTPLSKYLYVAMYPADRETVGRYVRQLRPDKAPRAMGTVPRLGIGTRMSTSVWPGMWRAMDRCRFAANAIQNSVRELNLLEDVLAGRPPRSNYLIRVRLAGRRPYREHLRGTLDGRGHRRL